MANYQDIRSIAIRQLRSVTASPESWKSFLSTAAIAYRTLLSSVVVKAAFAEMSQAAKSSMAF